jgi:hypothetical protein
LMAISALKDSFRESADVDRNCWHHY